MTKSKHKHPKYSTDDKFAVFAYCIFIFYGICCVLFDGVTRFVQFQFYAVYLFLLISSLCMVAVASFAIIFKKHKLEIVVLCLLLLCTIALFCEKSLFYFLSSKDFIAGHYTTYISLNIAEVTFVLYRLLKVKELLDINSQSAQYFKDYDERQKNLETYKNKQERR